MDDLDLMESRVSDLEGRVDWLGDAIELFRTSPRPPSVDDPDAIIKRYMTRKGKIFIFHINGDVFLEDEDGDISIYFQLHGT